MKRLLGMVLAILLTIAPLASCGGGNGGDNSKPDSSGTVSSDTVSGDTTDSSTVDSDTTDSSTVDSDTTGSSTVDSDTTGSSTVDSDTTGSSTVDSDTTGSSTVDSDTTGSSTVDSDTTSSSTVDSDTTGSSTVDSDTTDSGTVDSDTTDSSTTDSGTVDSGTDDPEPACQHSSRELKYDNTRHYYECTDCFEELDSEEHIEPDSSNEKGEFKCTVCDYVIRQENGIVFKTLTVDGKNVSGTVSNGTTAFYFIDEIKIKGATKYLLSYDIGGVQNIPAKTVSLEIGDNVFYIMELLNDEPVNVYTVTLRRRPVYEITFDTQGGTSVESYTVEEGSIINEPSSVKIGYDLVGWDYDFTKAVTGNTTIKAIWQSRTDTKYTVNYYQQNLENDEYTLKETDTLYGETDSTVNAVIKTYEHFTHNEGKGVLSGSVMPDGSLVLSVYYTRDSYQVTTGANYDNRGEYTKIDKSYKYGSIIELSASANEGYTFDGWYENGNMVSESSSYEITVDGEINLTATFSKNTDTKYIVNYYLQNLENDEYTLKETDTLYGETEAIVNAVIKTYEHFTHNEGKGVLSGSVMPDGSLVLSVYYTRDSYQVTTGANYDSRGEYTKIDKSYKYGSVIELSASANVGYTFDGWYENGSVANESGSYTITVDRDYSLTATFSKNTDTKYTVNYYHQNVNDDEYTLKETDTLYGETEAVVNAVIKTYEHFTHNEGKGTLSGTVTGDGNLVLSVYYDRETFTVSIDSGSGTVTGLGTYRYGEEVTISAVAHLGYEFIGWQSEGYEPVLDAEITITVNRNVFARFDMLEEMKVFEFTSSETECVITGLKDKSLTNIFVPSYVTKISKSAFSGCTALTELTLPFVGQKADGTGKTYFGYIFGASGYSENSSYVPSSLKKVTITGGNIGSNAFYGCTGLSEITIPSSVTSIGYYAFYGCTGLTSVTISEGVTSIGKYAFMDCTGLTQITIPSSVTSIGDDSAFAGCTGLKSVTIEEGVTRIGVFAFYGCTGLTEVEIPNSVISIGSGAFRGCTGLTKVEIPNSVTGVGSYAFEDCTGLTQITIPNSVTSIGSSAFWGCAGLTAVHITDLSAWCKISFDDSSSNPLYYANNLYVNGELLTNLVIPNDVTEIKDYAFCCWKGLKSVDIPSIVTSIGSCAFDGCTGLTSVTIEQGVTSIGEYVFYGCTGLTEVTIPSSVTEIGKNAFYGCTSLTELTIPFVGEKADGTGETYFGYIFGADSYSENSDYVPSSLKKVTITGGNIGSYAFYGCTGLTSVTIEQGVTSIGDYAFWGCAGLTEVEIPSSVTGVGSYAFKDCTGLSEITLPFVGEKADGTGKTHFGYIFGASGYSENSRYIPSSLKKVTITGGNIGSCAFYYCTGLTSVTIEQGVTGVGTYAFYGCTGLTEVEIPSSVTGVGESAFSGCTGLTEITIPSSVTEIGSNAFKGCAGLTSVTISEGVTGVGSRAFQNCTGLTRITIPQSVTSIGDYAFWGCTGLTEVEIPSSVTGVGSCAFLDCTGLTSVTIEEGVTSIGNSAFDGCTGLTEVTLPFVGQKADGTGATYFGYIFGASGYSYNGTYVPSSLKKVTITGDKIGSYAFYGCTGLTEIIISSSVKSIGFYAFYGCTGLTSVHITDLSAWCKISFADFYSNPLYYAYNLYLNGELLTNLVIPNDITKIKDYAFYYCESLKSVEIPSSVTGVGEYAFHACTGLTSVTIPSSVTEVGSRAFDGCTGLTSVTIEEGVTGVGEYAFFDCTGLTSVTIEEGVTRIGDSAFSKCAGLTEITIPSSVTEIGKYAFYGCTSLTELTLPFVGQKADGTGETHFGYIFGASEYSENSSYVPSSLKKVTITGGSAITRYAFYGCTSLTELTLPFVGQKADGTGETHFGYIFGAGSYSYNGSYVPSSLRKVTITGGNIGSNAFYGCKGLTEIIISSSVTSIGSYAFEGCTGLTEVEIPSSVTGVGSNAFRGCTGLTEVEIPNSVTSIADYAFYGCTGLTSVHISDLSAWCKISFANLYSNPLYYAKNLYVNGELVTNLVIPNDITEIKDYAFYSYESLKSVEIPSRVTGVGTYAFGDCTGLTQITIPQSVTSIGDYAFWGCKGLTSVTIEQGVTGVGKYAFVGCTGLTEVTIPQGVTSIGSCAFLDCTGLTSVTIEEGVTSIGNSAFKGCTGLSEITLPFVGEKADGTGETHFGYIFGASEYSENSSYVPSSLKKVTITGGSAITRYAFYGCTGLTEVTIPSSVTSIGDDAFHGCTGLTEITIPSSVTEIGSSAFWACTGLKTVYYGGTEAEWSSISIGSYNAYLTSATIYYNSEQN